MQLSISYDTPLMGRVTTVYDSVDSARSAIRGAERFGFTNITVNGESLPK
jgi:hypothetical protein